MNINNANQNRQTIPEKTKDMQEIIKERTTMTSSEKKDELSDLKLLGNKTENKDIRYWDKNVGSKVISNLLNVQNGKVDTFLRKTKLKLKKIERINIEDGVIPISSLGMKYRALSKIDGKELNVEVTGVKIIIDADANKINKYTVNESLFETPFKTIQKRVISGISPGTFVDGNGELIEYLSDGGIHTFSNNVSVMNDNNIPVKTKYGKERGGGGVSKDKTSFTVKRTALQDLIKYDCFTNDYIYTELVFDKSIDIVIVYEFNVSLNKIIEFLPIISNKIKNMLITPKHILKYDLDLIDYLIRVLSTNGDERAKEFTNMLTIIKTQIESTESKKKFNKMVTLYGKYISACKKAFNIAIKGSNDKSLSSLLDLYLKGIFTRTDSDGNIKKKDYEDIKGNNYSIPSGLLDFSSFATIFDNDNFKEHVNFIVQDFITWVSNLASIGRKYTSYIDDDIPFVDIQKVIVSSREHGVKYLSLISAKKGNDDQLVEYYTKLKQERIASLKELRDIHSETIKKKIADGNYNIENEKNEINNIENEIQGMEKSDSIQLNIIPSDNVLQNQQPSILNPSNQQNIQPLKPLPIFRIDMDLDSILKDDVDGASFIKENAILSFLATGYEEIYKTWDEYKKIGKKDLDEWKNLLIKYNDILNEFNNMVNNETNDESKKMFLKFYWENDRDIRKLMEEIKGEYDKIDPIKKSGKFSLSFGGNKDIKGITVRGKKIDIEDKKNKKKPKVGGDDEDGDKDDDRNM